MRQRKDTLGQNLFKAGKITAIGQKSVKSQKNNIKDKVHSTFALTFF